MKIKKLLALIGIICFISGLSLILCSGAVFADELQSESGPLPPSIAPVVILSGTDYKMGYQYGQQAGRWIEIRKMAYSPVTDELISRLKEGQSILKEHAPWAIEMMKGMAKGAKDTGYDVSYIDVLRMNEVYEEVDVPDYPADPEDEKLPPGCSVFAAWGSATTDGRLICGDSNDSSFVPTVTIVAFPDEGNRYIASGRAGALSRHPVMNNKGVFIGSSYGFAKRDIDFGLGIPGNIARVHLARFADSASSAKNMFLSLPYGECWNFLIADVSGDAFVIEATAAIKSVRKPGDFDEKDFIYCTNNYLTEEGGKAILGEEFVAHAGWDAEGRHSSIYRNKELWTMLDGYHGKVDLDFAKMMWRFPGKGLLSNGKQDSKICNLENRVVTIGLPDDGDKGAMYVCTGPAGRVAYSLTNESHFQVAGTHTFYQLVLTSNPADLIKAAKDEALDYIAEANQKLMWLSHADTGFAGLNELSSLANAEYYEGINWANKSKSASGDEQHIYYAKAATAFTKSQAHAKQVYYALVPPANDPTDLGLQPYKETAWDITPGNENEKDKN